MDINRSKRLKKLWGGLLFILSLLQSLRIGRQPCIQMYRQTGVQTKGQTDRCTEKGQTDRQTDVQTNAQADRQTDVQTNAQADRQIDRFLNCALSLLLQTRHSSGARPKSPPRSLADKNEPSRKNKKVCEHLL